MSRIGRKAIPVPAGVEVSFENGICTVKKGQNSLSQQLDPAISVQIENGEVKLSRSSDDKAVRSLHGLYRALIFNMIEGLEKGYSKTLHIEGIGYRAAKEGNKLVLTVGMSHTVDMVEPEGITYEVTKPTEIIVKGFDKQLVGEMAAKIRAVRPPEPYKGKGIRYAEEVVKLKEGKTGAK